MDGSDDQAEVPRGREDRLQRLAFGPDSSAAEREAALSELASLREREDTAARDDVLIQPMGPRRTNRASVWWVLSSIVSVVAVAYSHLVRIMYTFQVSDAPFLTAIPLGLFAPFETAAAISVIGSAAGLTVWLIYVISSRRRRMVPLFVALGLSAVALVNGVVIVPALVRESGVRPLTSSGESAPGASLDQLFNVPQGDGDLPVAALPTDVVVSSVHRLGGLTETGQAATYGALSPSGQVCLLVYDELGAYAETCRSVAETTTTGIEVKLRLTPFPGQVVGWSGCQCELAAFVL
ncbi:hypothetical protein B7R21_19330 [Subtercola boreus]|uniref:Uncharacterized protein n=1 Tax=Subtercola boreus TaxID=120213 RepID=A0A3E0VAW0_9MICO|nr:hypothetical protein [Subtercola boreus]RFA06618.1 hypothetical protein B7R21_19330 [Subtercola boreus]